MPTFDPAFLSGLREKNHVAVERHVLPLEHEHHHQRGHEVVLVVERTPPINVSAVARAAERREGPLRCVDRHHIGVCHDSSGRFLPLPLSLATRLARPGSSTKVRTGMPSDSSTCSR